MKTRQIRLVIGLLLFTWAAAFAGRAQGAIFYWDRSNAGQYQNRFSWNWSGSYTRAPDGGDDVFFEQAQNLGNVTNVRFGDQFTNRALTLTVWDEPNVIFDFQGSRLIVDGTVRLGRQSGVTAGLTIYDGQLANTSSGFIGDNAGSVGRVTVENTGRWDSEGSFLYIGRFGRGTLEVQGGGLVNSLGETIIARETTSGNSLLHVHGSNARFNGTGVIYVGHDAVGRALVQSNGLLAAGNDIQVGLNSSGTLDILTGGDVTSRSAFVGVNAGGSGQVNINGNGSSWTNSSDIFVGYFGNGTLNLSANGFATNANAFLGWGANRTGTATVDGSGSYWQTNGELRLGNSGHGVLNVTGDGDVYSTSGRLGVNAGSTGTATINGTGSTWTVDGSLNVGGSGVGSLKVENRGSLTSTFAFLGSNANSQGTVEVTGLLSTWHNNGVLYVGYDGNGYLYVKDRAVFNNHSNALIGSFAGSGYASVSGSSSWNNSGNLYVGYGAVGQLVIETGGDVFGDDGYLGFGSSTFGAAYVRDVGSSWSSNGILSVGYNGTGELHITNGGAVFNNNFGIIGYQSNGSGTVTVDGTGSLWQSSAHLTVGDSGSGSLSISDGGRVTNTFGTLGWSASAEGTATVTGLGSAWNNSSSLVVGRLGQGTLTVEDGGAVSASLVHIGDGTNSIGQVNVRGKDATTNTPSSLQSSGSLIVGYNGTAELNITQGGEVHNAFGGIGYDSNGVGRVLVNGIGSSWINSQNLTVGELGEGYLTIANGAAVSNTFGALGWGPSGMGEVTATGSGSQWINSGSLNVGLQGEGFLDIWNGAQVSNTVGVIGNFGDSQGRVRLSGTGSAWNNSAELYIGNSGEASLFVEDGGLVTNSFAQIGANSTGIGSVMVVNSNSTWNNNGYLVIGGSGEGSLEILFGGLVTNTSFSTIGAADTGVGLVTVRGNGSTWSNTGTLTIGNFGEGTLNVENNGFVSVDSSLGLALAAGSSGTLNINSGGKVRVGGNVFANLGTASFTMDDGTLEVGNSRTVSTNITLGPEGGTFELSGGSNTALISGTLSGPGSLTKIGGGLIELSSANSYLGTTFVNAGTLSITNGNALGDASGDTQVASGATLQLSGGIATPTGESLSLQGIGAGGNGALRSIAGSDTNHWRGTVDFVADSRIRVDSRELNLSGVVSGAGLEKTGGGVLRFSGTASNTYSGLTTVSEGFLSLHKSNGLNAIAGDGNTGTFDILINGGVLNHLASEQIADDASVHLTSGSWRLLNHTETLHNFTNSGGYFETGVGGQLHGLGASIVWNGGVSMTNIINADGLVSDGHVVINSTGGINEVHGAANPGPSGTNGGVLRVTSPGLGLEFTGGAPVLSLYSDDASPGQLSLQNNLRVDEAITGTAEILSITGGNLPGVVNLNNAARTFDVEDSLTLAAGTPELHISASIIDGPGVGSGSLVKVGEGHLRLSGDNTYTGDTTVNGDLGTLELVNPGALQNARVFVTAGEFLQSGGTNNINGAAGVNLDIAAFARYHLAGGTLDFHDSDGTPGSILSIQNNGEFEFSGGRLLDVTTIDPNSTTAGVSDGVFTQGGGRLVVGRDQDPPGPAVTSILGAYTQNSGALALDIFGNTANQIDMLVVDGDVTLDGELEINNPLGVNLVPFQWYNAVKTLGDGEFVSTNFTLNGITYWRIIGDPNGGFNQILQVAVPEPASVLLWAFLAAGLGLYIRRRRLARK